MSKKISLDERLQVARPTDPESVRACIEKALETPLYKFFPEIGEAKLRIPGDFEFFPTYTCTGGPRFKEWINYLINLLEDGGELGEGIDLMEFTLSQYLMTVIDVIDYVENYNDIRRHRSKRVKIGYGESETSFGVMKNNDMDGLTEMVIHMTYILGLLKNNAKKNPVFSFIHTDFELYKKACTMIAEEHPDYPKKTLFFLEDHIMIDALQRPYVTVDISDSLAEVEEQIHSEKKATPYSVAEIILKRICKPWEPNIVPEKYANDILAAWIVLFRMGVLPLAHAAMALSEG